MTNENILHDYFSLLEKTLTENNLLNKPHLIFNCDELGIVLNKMSQKVVVPVAQRRAFVVSCGSSDHISAHNVVSADGGWLPPMIIFKGSFPGGHTTQMAQSIAYMPRVTQVS
jgi:hypothetical protein